MNLPKRRFSQLKASSRPDAKTQGKGRDNKGARLSRAGIKNKLAGYRSHHRQVALDSLRRLLQKPLTSLMTSLVIAIALALPAGLYVALNNIDVVGEGWEGAARISLFLKENISEEDADSLRRSLQGRDDVRAAVYISPSEGLKQFREQSGFGDVLDQLDRNPLPGVIVITPQETDSSAASVSALHQSLAELKQVDQAKLDMAWLQRLYQITELGRRMTLGLAAMLAMGVLLIIGNTIKLAIEGRREEILVVKLVGGTNSFVRRPFLYTGFWYGLGGGLLAWLLLQVGLAWLRGPVSSLADLYHSDFSLIGLGFFDTLALWLLASGLGLLGAWLVVGRELRAIEPR